ncbi:MAG: metal-dependent hydrolase [Halobellus sp.]|uniref:metal-dependent hydrolase n=1 Tax=Halobellus sp. TaxID=1979212 RepID=UPI0035D4D612
MTPVGHLAAALLAATSAGLDRRQAHLCLVGALLPDLIDKPLWRAGVFATGHTIAHSIAVVCAVAALFTMVPQLRVLAPVVLGQATHIAGDLVVAYPKFLRNFAWPLLPQRPAPGGSPVRYWITYATSTVGLVELTLIVAAGVMLIRRGYPSDN